MPFQVSYNNPVKVMPFWNFSFSCLISSSCSWGHSSYPGAKYASYICPAYNLIELGSVPHHGTLTQYRVINEKGWQRSAQLLDGWFISVCEGGRQATQRRKKNRRNDERKGCSALHISTSCHPPWALCRIKNETELCMELRSFICKKKPKKQRVSLKRSKIHFLLGVGLCE